MLSSKKPPQELRCCYLQKLELAPHWTEAKSVTGSFSARHGTIILKLYLGYLGPQEYSITYKATEKCHLLTEHFQKPLVPFFLANHLPKSSQMLRSPSQAC